MPSSPHSCRPCRHGPARSAAVGRRSRAVQRLAWRAGIDAAFGEVAPGRTSWPTCARCSSARAPWHGRRRLNDGRCWHWPGPFVHAWRGGALARSACRRGGDGRASGRLCPRAAPAPYAPGRGGRTLAWAVGYNAVCVPLAVAGWMPAWLAGLGHGLSSLVVVMNAARPGAFCRWRIEMDILYLLIPLSMALALLILGRAGGPSGIGQFDDVDRRRADIRRTIDLRQPGLRLGATTET